MSGRGTGAVGTPILTKGVVGETGIEGWGVDWHGFPRFPE